MAVQLSTKSAGLSITGQQRSQNQDSFGCREPTDPRELAESGSLYIVADGVGGKSNGERSSQQSVQVTLREYYRSGHAVITQRLVQALQEANAKLLATSSANHGQSMRSTIVAAAVQGDQLIVAHVGDSRAYLFRDGVPQRLTHDHSLIQRLIDVGELTPETARDFARKNVISRSLGGSDKLEVDVGQFTLRPGDILLLCTDGLHLYFWEDHDLLQFISPDRSADEMARGLVEEANARGGSDNITAVVVKIGSSNAQPRPRSTRPARLARSPLTSLLRFLPLIAISLALTFIALIGGLFAGRYFASQRAVSPTPIATAVVIVIEPTITPQLVLSPTESSTAPLTPSAAIATETPPPPSPLPLTPTLCVWKIKLGETLGLIAQSSKSDDESLEERQSEIMRLNDIASPDKIFADALLIVRWTNTQTPINAQAPPVEVPGKGSYPPCPVP